MVKDTEVGKVMTSTILLKANDTMVCVEYKVYFIISGLFWLCRKNELQYFRKFQHKNSIVIIAKIAYDASKSFKT